MEQPGDQLKSYERDTRRHYQDDEVAKQYHEQFAEFSLRNITHLLVAKAEQRAVGRLLSSIRNDVTSIADIPCGTGKMVTFMGTMAVPAFGGDVSGSMLRIAKESARHSAPNMRFIRLDITRMPFPDGAFDAVVCLRLLHRVPTDVKKAALKELRRVTRRYAVVSYGLETVWHALRRRLRTVVSRGNTIPYGLTPSAMQTLFTEAELRVARKVSPLPMLSAEEIALLVK